MEGNQRHEALLKSMGYNLEGLYDYYRIRAGESPIPHYSSPDGFQIREITKADYTQQTLLIRRVFGHGE